MHIVIIGESINAVTAAAHLRRENEKNRITIINPSTEIGPALCGIPSFLQGLIPDINDLIVASPRLLYKVFNVNLLMPATISKINPELHTIHLSNGKKMLYDKIIFAFAKQHSRPAIKGILSDNIFTLHNTAAAKLVNEYFWGHQAKHIIILGGTGLAVQTASAFAANHAKVTIIEQSPHLLNYIDNEFALLVQKKLQEQSVRILTSASVKEFYPHYATLSDGSRINYDMAVIATETSSDFELLRQTGIKLGINGGIVVNQYLQTNLSDIYACGETIEITNSVSGSPFSVRNAALAAQTAKIAAKNVLGNVNQLPMIFNNELIPIFDNYLGICGSTEQELQAAELPYHAVWLNTQVNENYTYPASNIKMKLLFSPEGKILGLQMFGTQGIFSRQNIIAALMQKNGKITDLTNMYLSYTPTLARTKDCLNIIASLAVSVQSGDLKTINLNNLQKGDILLNFASPLSLTNHSFTVLNIPFTQLRTQLHSLPKNQIIAVYCPNGYSAYLGYCLLRNHGFNNVFLLNSTLGW